MAIETPTEQQAISSYQAIDLLRMGKSLLGNLPESQRLQLALGSLILGENGQNPRNPYIQTLLVKLQDIQGLIDVAHQNGFDVSAAIRQAIAGAVDGYTGQDSDESSSPAQTLRQLQIIASNVAQHPLGDQNGDRKNLGGKDIENAAALPKSTDRRTTLKGKRTPNSTSRQVAAADSPLYLYSKEHLDNETVRQAVENQLAPKPVTAPVVTPRQEDALSNLPIEDNTANKMNEAWANLAQSLGLNPANRNDLRLLLQLSFWTSLQGMGPVTSYSGIKALLPQIRRNIDDIIADNDLESMRQLATVLYVPSRNGEPPQTPQSWKNGMNAKARVIQTLRQGMFNLENEINERLEKLSTIDRWRQEGYTVITTVHEEGRPYRIIARKENPDGSTSVHTLTVKFPDGDTSSTHADGQKPAKSTDSSSSEGLVRIPRLPYPVNPDNRTLEDLGLGLPPAPPDPKNKPFPGHSAYPKAEDRIAALSSDEIAAIIANPDAGDLRSELLSLHARGLLPHQPNQAPANPDLTQNDRGHEVTLPGGQFIKVGLRTPKPIKRPIPLSDQGLRWDEGINPPEILRRGK